MSLALYRKYRPKTFSEIIGQDVVVQTLTNALSMGRISHAYLFCGPRGTGKTTIARLLAKAVNCAKDRHPTSNIQHPTSDFEPCNKCLSCQEINEGRCLDLIEIDAASNRGIDEIRNLKEGIRFAPIKSKYKVFVIDESHMLTKEAFNALLKTLEEPPAHAIFVLATTEPDRLPATIISRTQRFDFKRLLLDQMVERLQGIAKGEKLKIAPAALRFIALDAKGGMRDAESLLDQIISQGYKEVDESRVEELLGLVSFQKLDQFAGYLIKKDAPSAIKFVIGLYEYGSDLERFSKAFLEYLRHILMLQISPELENLLKKEATDSELAVLKNRTKEFPKGQLENLIKKFSQTEQEIKGASIPTLPLELAIVEIINNIN